MINAAEKYLKYTKETPIKPWINSKMIDLFEKRRIYKNVSNEEGRSEYNEYRNLVKQRGKESQRLMAEQYLQGYRFLPNKRPR